MARRSTEQKLSVRGHQIRLPFWDSVVFVDWHGVLSNDLFWESIRSDPLHRHYASFAASCDRLFRWRRDLVIGWMTGLQSCAQIIAELQRDCDIELDEQYLHDILHRDCRSSALEPTLVEALFRVRPRTFVVLATDNMDCFWANVDRIPIIASVFDAVLCSSELGILKTEDPWAFFGPWLESHRLQFSHALLLDDTPDVCDAFTACGGRALRVNGIENAVVELEAWCSRLSGP